LGSETLLGLSEEDVKILVKSVAGIVEVVKELAYRVADAERQVDALEKRLEALQ
jgi:hypothetical protein